MIGNNIGGLISNLKNKRLYLHIAVNEKEKTNTFFLIMLQSVKSSFKIHLSSYFDANFK